MRKKTKTIYQEEVLKAIEEGINELVNPVILTMGARGGNGGYMDGFPVVTNDGISIARSIFPENQFNRYFADLALQAAERTNIEVSDSTSATLSLSKSIALAGVKLIRDGKDCMELRNEMSAEADLIVEKIKEKSIPVTTREQLLNIAQISVENREIAEIVTDATEKAGNYGSVVVEEGNGKGMEIEEVKGYGWDQGYISQTMVTNPRKMEAVLEDCAVVVTDKHMNQNKDLLGLLTDMHSKGVKNFLVVADNIEGDLLATFIQNKLKNIITVIAVKRPQTYDELEDIATLVGATAVTRQSGIKQIEKIHLGFAKKIVVTDKKTTILTDDSPALQERVSNLIDLAKTDDSVKERLGRLTDGKIILRVGAKTEADRNYLKLKVDDAVGACRAAKEEGSTDGGGVTLKDISKELEGKLPILGDAILSPYQNILSNAKITPDGKNYDVLKKEEVKNMTEAGIIDSSKGVRCAIENSVSFAKTALTMKTLTLPIEEVQESEK